MVRIHLGPTGVDEVVVASGSPLEQDLDVAAWQTVRGLVDQMDRRLRRAARRAVAAPVPEKSAPPSHTRRVR